MYFMGTQFSTQYIRNYLTFKSQCPHVEHWDTIFFKWLSSRTMRQYILTILQLHSKSQLSPVLNHLARYPYYSWACTLSTSLPLPAGLASLASVSKPITATIRPLNAYPQVPCLCLEMFTCLLVFLYTLKNLKIEEICRYRYELYRY